MPRTKTGMTKINLYIQPEILRGLKFIADKRGTNYSGIIRDACRAFVISELRVEKDIAETVDLSGNASG